MTATIRVQVWPTDAEPCEHTLDRDNLLNDTCKWERAEDRQTRQDAKDHAKQTGHNVLVVTETRDLYGVSQ